MPEHPLSSNAVTSVLPVRPSVLTESALKNAQPGDVLKDGTVTGLHVRCFPESKGFYLYYRTKAGIQRRPKLGDYGTITVAQARKVAKEMLAEVAAGRDPSAKRAESRAEATVKELWDEIWTRQYSKGRSQGTLKGYWKHIEPVLGRKRLSEVRHIDIVDLHTSLSKDHPVTANRVTSLLARMFSFAVRPLEWMPANSNPVTGLERNKEKKRRRYMKGEEAAKIATILHRDSASHPASVAFLYLLILTGARKSEIANAKWSMIAGSRIVLTEHKTDGTGEDRFINLPQAALNVLATLPKTSGTITGIKDPKKYWDAVRTEAGCPDLRMHDLRHSFASAAISAGLSLAQIGELLGHRSAQTTHRYAHLMEEAAQAAVTATADVIAIQMKKTPAKAGA